MLFLYIFIYKQKRKYTYKKISLKIRENLQGDAMIKVQTAPFPYG